MATGKYGKVSPKNGVFLTPLIFKDMSKNTSKNLVKVLGYGKVNFPNIRSTC